MKNQSKSKSSSAKKMIKKVSQGSHIKKITSSSDMLKNDIKKIGRDIAKAASETVAQVRKKAISSIHRVEQRLK